MNPAIIWKGSITTSEEIGGTDAFYVRDIIITPITGQLVSDAVGHHSVFLQHNYADSSLSYIMLVEFMAMETEIIHLNRYFAAGDSLVIQHTAQAPYSDPIGVHVTGEI